jgi:hypothetical protein
MLKDSWPVIVENGSAPGIDLHLTDARHSGPVEAQV